MRDARVPDEEFPQGAARGRQRRRTSAAPRVPPDLPGPRTPLPRDRRWLCPGPGTAALTYRRRGVTLTERRGACPSLRLCPSYRLSFRSGESAPLYLRSRALVLNSLGSLGAVVWILTELSLCPPGLRRLCRQGIPVCPGLLRGSPRGNIPQKSAAGNGRAPSLSLEPSAAGPPPPAP
ncbi:uncharacterized protein LOC119695630 isoform X2 [Motacilla alba alba]|uniref:uncharacterized protein LOC119695630 isoform X2 n=1 Tax=Motacilla alba alba TaxID=1094192 RepID=UPI0018D500BF|nr:uncharacterized protein LOC119695630 isoform X2 [Motacilla alba alba]